MLSRPATGITRIVSTVTAPRVSPSQDGLAVDPAGRSGAEAAA